MTNFLSQSRTPFPFPFNQHHTQEAAVSLFRFARAISFVSISVHGIPLCSITFRSSVFPFMIMITVLVSLLPFPFESLRARSSPLRCGGGRCRALCALTHSFVNSAPSSFRTGKFTDDFSGQISFSVNFGPPQIKWPTGTPSRSCLQFVVGLHAHTRFVRAQRVAATVR